MKTSVFSERTQAVSFVVPRASGKKDPNWIFQQGIYTHLAKSMFKNVHPGTRLASVVRTAKNIYAVRRRIATVAAAVLTIGLGYHVVFGRNGLFVYQQKRMDTRNLDGELHTLQQENDRLKVHVDRLQSDPDAIEHQAREELHYTRPGEVIYTLPAQTAAPANK